jgi:hypothetical protein
MGSTNGVGLILNCEFYFTYANNTHCISCKKGYRGLLSNNGTEGYIQSCEAFTACDTTKEVQHSIHSNISAANYPFKTNYNKSTFDLNVFFNGCAACTTATNVLVAYVGSELLPVQYDSTNLTTTNPTTNHGYNLDCQAPGATIGTVVMSTLPANCAKVIAIVAVAAPLFKCVQCKAGYYPTRVAADPSEISACTAFTQCADVTVPNICKKCNTGYYFRYDSSTQSVLYEGECITVTDKPANCFAIETNGACGFCEKGYHL